MIIRPLCICDLENSKFIDTLQSLAEVNLPYASLQEIFLKRIDRIDTYIALSNNLIVGTASLHIENKFIHNGGLVGYIEDVAVIESHRNKGVGKALVDYLVEESVKKKCYKVILSCKESLVDYYTKLGFRSHEITMRLDI